eukprot:TRINITY_DN14309_c0_g1_i1.p1 TRINITY_DN14309_c0_g1~~TRINITY_DN14309_c0_g1_i1.p1  ORF type:complete len:186 (-),score=20.25 TRINITY_DN14309_c0_g1_i1:11-568(-)
MAPHLQLLELPEEMVAQIWSHLPLPDLLNVRQVCKYACAVADQDDMWQKLVYRDFQQYSLVEATWYEEYRMHYQTCELYLDDIVVRDKDWLWGDQDGGSGNQGTVTSRARWEDSTTGGDTWTEYNAVNVKWSNAYSDIYRFGYENSYDVRPLVNRGRAVKEDRWAAKIARRKAKCGETYPTHDDN